MSVVFLSKMEISRLNQMHFNVFQSALGSFSRVMQIHKVAKVFHHVKNDTVKNLSIASCKSERKLHDDIIAQLVFIT